MSKESRLGRLLYYVVHFAMFDAWNFEMVIPQNVGGCLKRKSFVFLIQAKFTYPTNASWLFTSFI
jgi:hypothetical protein